VAFLEMLAHFRLNRGVESEFEVAVRVAIVSEG
jgi:hypothetical protein